MGGRGSGGSRPGGVPRDKNPIVQGNDMTNVNPGTNSRALGFAAELMQWGEPDYSSAEAMEARLFEFLALCERWNVKPMVQACATAFGMTRQTYSAIAHGDESRYKARGLTRESMGIVQKSYALLQTVWEINLCEEKGNPVKWIFFGKNHFGYTDKTEAVVCAVDDTRRDLPTPEAVAAKYAAMVGHVPAELPPK